MSGRLFVASGDITLLRCNAWLLPTDAALNVSKGWLNSASNASKLEASGFEMSDGRRLRTLVLEPWSAALRDAPAPVPILTNTGGTKLTSRDWYLDGLREFVAVAARVTNLSTWRSKRLFAVPLIGTGAGGQALAKGGLLAAIVSTLEALAKQHDVDIVLIARNAAAYSALQKQRRVSLHDQSPELLATAESLARLARASELVLFLGAGISRPAGLPLGTNSCSMLRRL